MLSESNQDFLRPVSSDEFLPPISPWTTLGGLFLVGTVGVAITLAAFTKYNVTVKAPAIVRPTGEIKVAQAATEGTVKSIAVKENQVVKQGDAIAYIDDSQLQTKKSQLQNNIQQSQQQLMQLHAQIQAVEGQITSETDLQNRSIRSAEAELALVQRQYQEKQMTTAADVVESAAMVQSAKEELQKAVVELKSTEANLKSSEAALKAAITRRDRYKPLVQVKALPLDRFEEAQLAVDQQQQAVEAQKALLLAQKQTIAQQEQAVEAAQARRKGTLAAVNPSVAVVAVAREKIAQERATGGVSLAKLQQERQTLLQNQVTVETQIKRDRQELAQIDKDLKRSIIRSAVDGTILQLNLRNADQVVSAGEAIAQIAPNNAVPVIKAHVLTQDIGKINLGQDAQLRISAYPYPDYGVLKGKVNAIAPDVVTPKNNETGVAATYYEVTIQPEKPYLVKSDRRYFIQPGMDATAEIISKQETFLTFIFRKARLLTDL